MRICAHRADHAGDQQPLAVKRESQRPPGAQVRHGRRLGFCFDAEGLPFGLPSTLLIPMLASLQLCRG